MEPQKTTESQRNYIFLTAKEREENLKKCVQIFVHASQCRDINCRRPKCPRLKQILTHVRQCKKRQESQCSICKQLFALCLQHSKSCILKKCKVHFCDEIRAKIAEEMKFLPMENIERYIRL